VDPDTLRMARAWRLRTLGLLIALGLAGARPLPSPPPAPAARPVAAPPRMLEAKSKTCDPACKAPEICADGTCAMPANKVHGEPHSAAQVLWTFETLR